MGIDKRPRRIVPKFVDISHHNTGSLSGGRIDFVALRAAGILGVVHKASQGTRMRDRMYHERRQQARDAGLRWGLYHFADNNSNGAAQVDFCLSYAKPAADESIWLDAEQDTTTGRTVTEPTARQFMDAVMRSTRRKPGIYGGNWVKENIRGADAAAYWSQFRLWLCQYRRDGIYSWPDAWPWIWALQYTDGNRSNSPGPYMLPGFDPRTRLDINSYGGTDEEFHAEWAGAAV